jgi:hypothetical protein
MAKTCIDPSKESEFVQRMRESMEKYSTEILDLAR